MDKTVGQVREILLGFPDEYPINTITLEDPEFVIIVDSRGNSQRILLKTRRTLAIYIDLPVAS